MKNQGVKCVLMPNCELESSWMTRVVLVFGDYAQAGGISRIEMAAARHPERRAVAGFAYGH
jgi:hypothetical protein